LKKTKIALKSSKELAEELFSPEGENRKSIEVKDDYLEESSNQESSKITKISSSGRRASKERLTETPSLFDNDEPRQSSQILKGAINDDVTGDDTTIDHSNASIKQN